MKIKDLDFITSLLSDEAEPGEAVMANDLKICQQHKAEILKVITPAYARGYEYQLTGDDREPTDDPKEWNNGKRMGEKYLGVHSIALDCVMSAVAQGFTDILEEHYGY